MFTLVHVHLFSIVFYFTHADWSITRSEWLWLAMSDSGSLWVAMARYMDCLVPPVFFVF